MSLATDLTQCQERLVESGRRASAEVRRLKGTAPAPVYDELMLQLCNVTAEANRLKALLGTLRMLGELEQRPPVVKVEDLELFEHRAVPMDALLASLHRAGDHTLDGEGDAA